MSERVNLDVWYRRAGEWYGCLPDRDYRHLSSARRDRESVVRWAELVLKARGDDRELMVKEL